MSEHTRDIVEELYSMATALPSDGEWIERNGDMLPINVCTRAADELATLKRQCDMLLEALKKYADRQNWGYYDDSGCDKGHGEYTDACFIGPEVAQAVIAAVEGEK